jgi:hypothetical protein
MPSKSPPGLALWYSRLSSELDFTSFHSLFINLPQSKCTLFIEECGASRGKEVLSKIVDLILGLYTLILKKSGIILISGSKM